MKMKFFDFFIKSIVSYVLYVTCHNINYVLIFLRFENSALVKISLHF